MMRIGVWWITAVLTAVLFMSGCARPLPAGMTPLPVDLPATPTLAATSSPGVPLEESVKPPATATAPPPVVTPSATPLAPTATPPLHRRTFSSLRLDIARCGGNGRCPLNHSQS
ncbi:MAG: hypothetical protein M5U34_24000 [Chloroflexi bacterium]|nr:hypothetical protein [Chloroflexota bacterium]